MLRAGAFGRVRIALDRIFRPRPGGCISRPPPFDCVKRNSDAGFRWGAYAVTCSKISIGSRVVIRPGSMLFAFPYGETGRIVIEDDVLIGSGVHVYTSNHSISDLSRRIIDQGHDPAADVIVRRGAWIGANAILLPGVEIGEGAVVGAGSVVTRSIAAGMIAVGNPARPVRARGDHKTSPADADRG